jgi:hypothetical protein
MALYIPHSIFHLARLLYVRPETFGPCYGRCGFDAGREGRFKPDEFRIYLIPIGTGVVIQP